MLQYIVGSVIITGVLVGIAIKKCNDRVVDRINEEAGSYTRMT